MTMLTHNHRYMFPMGRIRRTVAGACLLGLAAGLSLTQPAQAAGVVSPANTEIKLDISRGTLIRLDHPATSVFVANPAIADVQVKSPRLIYVFGKAAGETSLYAVSGRDKVIYSSTIRVAHSIGRLKAAIKTLAPDENVDIQEIDGTLILTGSVKSAKDAESVQNLAQKLAGTDHPILNRLQIQAPIQINLRVRIAEVSRDISKQLGFNWQGGIFGGKVSLGIRNTVQALTGTTPATGSYFGSFTSGKVDINTVVDALETEGFLKVLAEPNLTALSGKTASFLAGGEFPIPVPQGGTTNTVTITYKEYGVSLTFTPTVMSDNKINLKVAPEVSELSNTGSVTLQGFNIPAITTRRAETTVELGSGQSFAIAGLLQSNSSNDVNKLPGLGDLPILGALFRSTKFRRQESELLIIVTPYIVRPVSGTKIPLPTDGFVEPTDAERILKGATYHSHAPETMPAPQNKVGAAPAAPAGFILN